MNPQAGKKWRLATSNPHKLAEYRRLGLDAEMLGTAPDLPEPDCGFMEVSLRKAIACGPWSVAEDTALEIEGADVGANVRWLLDRVGEFVGRKARFCVALSSFDGETAKCYTGAVEGLICEPQGQSGFGFDACFAPDGAGGLSLARLEELGRKDEFSARKRACDAFAAGLCSQSAAASELGTWTGAMQKGKAPKP